MASTSQLAGLGPPGVGKTHLAISLAVAEAGRRVYYGTLTGLIGRQHVALMLYASRRLGSEEAHRVGLVGVLVPRAEIRGAAPAVRETRAIQRAGPAERVEAVLEHELEVQKRLSATDDFREGAAALNEHRPARFRGR